MSLDSMQKARKLVQTDRHSKAIPLLKKICKSEPTNAEAYYLYGCSLARLQKFTDAVITLKKCIEIQPNVAQSHFALAGVYVALGKQEEARNSLNTTLKHNKSMAEAHVALANLSASENSETDAKNHLNKALIINPKLSDAHLGLGQMELKDNNFSQAITHLKQALVYNPKSEKVLFAMGSALVNLARTENKPTIEEAKSCYQKAIRLNPNYIDALAGLAIVYEFCNEPDKAMRIIEPLVKKKIYHPSIAIVLARTCKYNDRCEEAISYINKLVKQPNISTAALETVHMAAGKILDKLERYEEAFKHYKAGNELDKQSYDATAHSKWIDEQIRTFSATFLNSSKSSSIKDNRPIFVVGMPRSGTSLTEQILSANPQVYGAGELSNLEQIISETSKYSATSRSLANIIETLDQKTLDSMSSKYLEHLTSLSENSTRIVDKMPFNYYYLGIIQILFPEARIIHCKRNPMDTCLSIYFQGFSKRHTYANDLYNIGTNYHQYQNLMKHWNQVLSIPIFELSYEELVDNQESTIRELTNFCEIEWNDNCLEFYKLNRAVNTPSYDQVRQPLYTKSVNRWKNYEPFIEDLKKSLLE